jgi:hypothetical protein
MSGERMHLDRFRSLVDAYGANQARWPEAERAAAVTLAQGSAEAQALLRDAARLDEVLDLAPSVAPSTALLGAVLARQQGATGWWRALLGAMPIWQPAAALVLAAILGLGLGSSGTLMPRDEVVVDVAALSLAVDLDEDGTGQ